MGGGSWTTKSFCDYTTASKSVTLDELRSINASAQTFYSAYKLSDKLNPKNVMRECRDSEEHPNTLPVILALDVTGSMGGAAVEVAKKLNDIMTELYTSSIVKDIEFCIMGIGDFACDIAPLQISQFESDVRIAEQLDELFFEGGGGGNAYESYTSAWYMGLHHCDLDCWKRGKKGIIITLGDELPNPIIPKDNMRQDSSFVKYIGDSLQADIETKDLYKEVIDKFNVYHISVDDIQTSYKYYNKTRHIDEQWQNLIGEKNYYVTNLDSLSNTIVNIILNNVEQATFSVDEVHSDNENEVSW